MVGGFAGAEPQEKERERSPRCLPVCGGRGSGELLTREQPALGEAEQSLRKVPHSPHQESAHNLPTAVVDYEAGQDPKSLISWLKEILCHSSNVKTCSP